MNKKEIRQNGKKKKRKQLFAIKKEMQSVVLCVKKCGQDLCMVKYIEINLSQTTLKVTVDS